MSFTLIRRRSSRASRTLLQTPSPPKTLSSSTPAPSQEHPSLVSRSPRAHTLGKVGSRSRTAGFASSSANGFQRALTKCHDDALRRSINLCRLRRHFAAGIVARLVYSESGISRDNRNVSARHYHPDIWFTNKWCIVTRVYGPQIPRLIWYWRFLNEYKWSRAYLINVSYSNRILFIWKCMF